MSGPASFHVVSSLHLYIVVVTYSDVATKMSIQLHLHNIEEDYDCIILVPNVPLSLKIRNFQPPISLYHQSHATKQQVLWLT